MGFPEFEAHYDAILEQRHHQAALDALVVRYGMNASGDAFQEFLDGLMAGAGGVDGKPDLARQAGRISMLRAKLPDLPAGAAWEALRQDGWRTLKSEDMTGDAREHDTNDSPDLPDPERGPRKEGA